MILLIGFIISLTACSVKFDASGYVKACLDAAFHEEYESYAEFVDSTVEEAETFFYEGNKQNITNEIDSLEDITVTEEQSEEYLNLIRNCKKLTKYEVKSAKETETGYEVTVLINPVNVYKEFKKGIEDSYIQAANEDRLNEKTIFPIMLEFLNKCITEAEYEDTVEFILHIEQNGDSVWSIPQDELYELEELLLPRS